MVKPVRTESFVSPELKVTALALLGSAGMEPSIIVAATTFGSSGFSEVTVTALPKKLTFS